MGESAEGRPKRRQGSRPTRVRRKDSPWREAKRIVWTEELKAQFLYVLMETGFVVRAAEAIGADKSSPYKLRARDPEFAADWALAREIAYDEMRDVLRERVIEGVPKVLHYQGKVFATIRAYSDRLAELMMRHAAQIRERPFTATAPSARPDRQISDRVRAHAIALLRANAAGGAGDD